MVIQIAIQVFSFSRTPTSTNSAEFIRKGMAAGRQRPSKTPKPVKLRGGPLTTEEIEAAIAWGRD